jgi:hypothetical protein
LCEGWCRSGLFDGESLGIGGLNVLAQIKRRVWDPASRPPQLLEESRPIHEVFYGKPVVVKLLVVMLETFHRTMRPITVVGA